MCQHMPRCPDARATDRTVARVLVSHPEQGWSLLCNGVVLFDDACELILENLAAPVSPAAARDQAPASRAAA